MVTHTLWKSEYYSEPTFIALSQSRIIVEETALCTVKSARTERK